MKIRSIIDRHRGLIVILTAFTLLGLGYDFTVPFFEKPDELKHFAVIHYIQQQKQLPVVRAGVYKAWDQEGTQPPLYHILAASLVSWLDLSRFEEPPRNPHYVDERSFIWRKLGNNNLYLHPPGEAWRIEPVYVAAHLCRWLSLLAGLSTISLTYLLGRLILEDQTLALLGAAMIACIPQFLHVSSAITNDSLSATLAAASLVGLALVWKRGDSTRRAVHMGLLLGLGAITKLSLLYLAPLTGLVFLLESRKPGRVVKFGLIIGGLMSLVAGWWYLRNWQLYGDITALNAHLLYRGGPLTPRPSLGQIWQTELTGLALSFWAAFGAGQILLEPWLYTALGGLKYLIGLGLVWGIVRNRRDVPLRSFLLLGLWTLMIFAALLRWMQITPASWGRLLYPTLPALGVLAAWSLSRFRLPRLPAYTLPLLLTACLFGLALVSPFRYIRAAYAKTPLIAETKLPRDRIEPVELVYVDALRLIGYRVEKPTVRPGEWLPVTLYWQAIRPIEKNYSVFVHLLGTENKVIGQANTYPDGGNWPTSMLEPGRILPDTYYVPISDQADAPAVIRLAMGIFEFEDPLRAAKPAINAAGQQVDPIVGAVPLLPRRWPSLNPSQPLAANFAGQIRLVGYDWPLDSSPEPGQTIPLTLYWETLAPPGQDLNLFIHLVDRTGGQQITGFDAPPDFPTRFWQTGYTIIDSRRLPLPADLPAGVYELRLGWYDLETLRRLPLENRSGDTLALPPFLVPQVDGK